MPSNPKFLITMATMCPEESVIKKIHLVLNLFADDTRKVLCYFVLCLKVSEIFHDP